ncbi:MAG: copper resistance protein B [Alphaproteobacteria bacterium]
MRYLAIILAAVLLPYAAAAQHAGHKMPAKSDDPHAGHKMPAKSDDPHAGHRMGADPDAPPKAPPPADALSGPAHAADKVFDPATMRQAREQLRAEQGDMLAYKVMIDELETRIHHGRDGYGWDAQAWIGGDIDKLWIETEGEGAFDEKPEQVEVQVLWNRAISPWYDARAGIRYDFRPDPERGYLVLGLQGLVPYMFEVDAAAFVSEKGDVSARIEAEYDLLLTQRLILQPRAEVNVAVQDVREHGIGGGVSGAEVDLRLRYEFAREFAPYVGISYERKFGQTADFARDEGEDVDDVFFVIGVRAWF